MPKCAFGDSVRADSSPDSPLSLGIRGPPGGQRRRSLSPGAYCEGMAVLLPVAHAAHWLWVLYLPPVLIVIASVMINTLREKRKSYAGGVGGAGGGGGRHDCTPPPGPPPPHEGPGGR